ncbi:MAG TPA: NAD kinase [Nocardioidaceae bacterium]|nr:NAD kinase [Nocardioidaceae bacterium]
MTDDRSGDERRVLVVTHPVRAEAATVAADFCAQVTKAGMQVRLLEGQSALLNAWSDDPEIVSGPDAAEGCELIVVFGGDGTILRGAELARPSATPLLGVNLGHVGFLAEAEVDNMEFTVDRVVNRTYDVEERLTIDVEVFVDGLPAARDWALNEASVEKAARERMLELMIEVDARPLSRFGCDGVVCATPTGSTAYNFSAGGPIVWPQVEALLMVPISAHALFARPMVVSPDSVLAIEVATTGADQGVLWCDGRRKIDLARGARVEVRRGQSPVRLARLHRAPFTDRLVRKFELPVTGWRGRGPAGG